MVTCSFSNGPYYVDKRNVFDVKNCLAEFKNVDVEYFTASIDEIDKCPRSFFYDIFLFQ